jgi:hypothetical protein
MNITKYPYVIVLLSFVFCRCNNGNRTIVFQKKEIQHNHQWAIGDTADLNKTKISDTSQQSESETVNDNQDNTVFLKDYGHSLRLDTILQIDGNTIKINHQVLREHYILPIYFAFKKGTAKKIMRTRTLIEIDESKFIIAADSFRRLIPYNPYVAKYGILLDPEIQVKTDSIVISFNYSIPYTDLGYPVTVSINCNKPRIAFHY